MTSDDRTTLLRLLDEWSRTPLPEPVDGPDELYALFEELRDREPEIIGACITALNDGRVRPEEMTLPPQLLLSARRWAPHGGEAQALADYVMRLEGLVASVRRGAAIR